MLRSPFLPLLIAASLPAQNLQQVLQGASGSRFGSAVSALGDVDGDGHDDFAIGAPHANVIAVQEGEVRVYSGHDGSVLWIWRGSSSLERFGWSVGNAGDVDGDGRADVVVGAIGHAANGANSGAAFVRSGRTGSVLHAFFGSGPFELFGWSVAGNGDIDGDGYDDILIGAPGDDANGADSGSATVFSGRTGTPLHRFENTTPNEQFGNAVAIAGDTDGDRRDDVLVGAPFADDIATDAGRVMLFSGRDGSVLQSIAGVTQEALWGYSIAPCGDVDRDGRDDWIVGAPFHSWLGEARGTAWLLSGSSGLAIHAWFGAAEFDRFGWAVASAGDFDGDGVLDVVVGAPGVDRAGQFELGAARVLSGANSVSLAELVGQARGDNLGQAVGGGFDSNANGHGEVLIGSGLVDGPAPDQGYVARIETANVLPARPRFRTFGGGCVGSNLRLPRIDARGRPALGETLDVSLRGGPTGSRGVLSVDFNTRVRDLGAVGASGCRLYTVAVQGPSTTVGGDGTARVQLTLPSDPTLIGTIAYAQWLLVDAPANSLGVIGSNALLLAPGWP